MAHISEPRVLETSTTTGTGALTLAGAVTGFRAFSAVCAVSDTCLYYIEAVDGSGVPTGEWECGLGTYSGANTLTRTTPVRSSNAGAAVNLSAGTKRVGITILGDDIHTAAPSTDQNNYDAGSLADLINCKGLRLGITASLKLTGLAATYDGHEIVIANTSTDFLLWLEHQSTGSTAANRFDLPNGFPFFLMPSDRITLRYSSVSSRWQTVSASSNLSQMGLTLFSDCLGGTATATLGHAGGGLTIFASGTGAAAASSTYLANTTERPMGIIQLTSGTTATGRAGIGDNGTDQIIPTLGAALSVARLAVQTTVSGTETFQVLSGFIDSLAAGATTDGVAWNNRWNGAAAEWAQDRYAATVRTGSTTGSPTPDNNYIWLVVFVNPGWTRADFIYSTDSVSFVKADSPTTGLPSSTQRTSWCPAQIIKSVGTTARLVAVDLAGYRVDYVRG
ncbi:MAG: hypothetical protein SFV24_19150 [Gemmatimonadales bacterium]|nr:hypothetical protein [Gemmatimonadales bacterium]